MSTDNVVPFVPRPRRALLQVTKDEILDALDSYQVVSYTRAAIHEGVAFKTLVSALHRAGLTVTNVTGAGLVIHAIGQHPEQPARPCSAIHPYEEPA